MMNQSLRLSSSLYDVSLDQIPPDSVLVCNPTDEKLLVQVQRLPAWLHCSFDWLHEPILLEPGEERTLDFWIDPYVPGRGSQPVGLSPKISFLCSTVRHPRILDCELNEKNPVSLSLTVHALARHEICQRCLVLSVGLVFLGLYPLIAVMLTPLNSRYLFAIALPVSLVFWIAWVVRRGVFRGWLESIYSRCTNPEDRRLVLRTGRIYGWACDRTQGRRIQLLCLPVFYGVVLFCFSFAYMSLDLVGFTDSWIGRLIILGGYLMLLGKFILSIYPETLGDVGA